MRSKTSALFLISFTVIDWISYCWSQGNTSQFEWKYGFSECYDGKRDMYYYSNKEVTCPASQSDGTIAKPPATNLSCTLECGRGFFLGVNVSDEKVVSTCQRCPQGSYSIGGGMLFSKITNSWGDKLPVEIYTECLTRDMLTGHWSDNCNPWTADSNGLSISSGDNSHVFERFGGSRLTSTLRISATLVREGKVTFQYKVEAEDPYDGLAFLVDTDVKMEITSQTNGWKELEVTLPAGTHSLSWEYAKDYSGDEGADRAWIRVIEIEGTSYSDTRCHPCGGDMTSLGESFCRFCKVNEYAEKKSESSLEFECKKCPNDQFSPEGSIGASSCKERRPCDTIDYSVNYTSCTGGSRTAKYFWSTPQTCSPDMIGSVSLPQENTVSCGLCDEGYYIRNGGDQTCHSCPGGQSVSASTNVGSPCADCPAGTFAQKVLYYGQGSWKGWSEWPKFIDSQAAKASGWKLTHDGIVHDMDGIGSTLKYSTEVTSQFVMPMKIPFVSAGHVNITYELKNLPPDYSSNPSSLEPSVYFDLEHNKRYSLLEHGRNNGSFTEIIPINASGKHTFEWIWSIHPGNAKDIEALRSSIRIIQMNISSTDDGSARDCISCPKGSIAFQNHTGCAPCGVGSVPAKKDNVMVCQPCPSGTYAFEDSLSCKACGKYTTSDPGSGYCRAIKHLNVDSSLSNESEPFQYDLQQLQNSMHYQSSDTSSSKKDQYIPSTVVNVSDFYTLKEIKGDQFAFGIFRYVHPLLSDGHELITTSKPGIASSKKSESYVFRLVVTNVNDSGNTFHHRIQPYGQVQCTIPSIFQKVCLGSVIDSITASDRGDEIVVTYSRGDICNESTQERYGSQIHFLCDMKAGNDSKPQLKKREPCIYHFKWRTPLACPLCRPQYFSQTRTECVSGTQGLTWRNTVPCHDGDKGEAKDIGNLDEENVRHCNSITLDNKTMYSMYAGVAIVCGLIVILLLSVYLTHRKYRNAYDNYMYLKGQMGKKFGSARDSTGKKIGDETTFEFDNNDNNTVFDSPSGMKPQSSSLQDTEDEEVEIEMGSFVNGTTESI